MEGREDGGGVGWTGIAGRGLEEGNTLVDDSSAGGDLPSGRTETSQGVGCRLFCSNRCYYAYYLLLIVPAEVPAPASCTKHLDTKSIRTTQSDTVALASFRLPNWTFRGRK